MNKIKLFFIGILLSATFLTSGYAAENTNALLWKVSGNRLEKSSYILGTFHLASKTMLDNIPGATDALANSEQIVGEVVMNDLAAMAQQVQQAGMMSPDTTYQMLYTEYEYQRVSNNIQNLLGAGLDQVGVLKPNFISQMVSLLMYQEFLPEINPNEMMDSYVQQYALSAEKPVIGLETVEEQIDVLFNSSSLKRQAEQLLCALDNPDYIKKSVIQLIEAYNNKDLAAMEMLFDMEDDPCQTSKAELDILLKNRNDNWIKKLPAIMLEKSSFIAVGAGHLVGNDGIVAQLQALGYTVEPVK